MITALALMIAVAGYLHFSGDVSDQITISEGIEEEQTENTASEAATMIEYTVEDTYTAEELAEMEVGDDVSVIDDDVATLDISDEDMLTEMAMTLLDMNRKDEAAAAYRDVISMYPTSEEAVQAAGLLKNIYAAEGHGDRYLAFMESVENAPEVSADDTERLTFESAMATHKRSGDSAPLKAYLDRFPDAPHAPQALLIIAQEEYDADRIPESLELFKTLETKAPNSTIATDARLGVMRAARDLGDYALAGSTAEAIINSSAAPAALAEAVYTRGVALDADGRTAEAIELWQSQAADTKNIFGAKSAYHAAEALFESGETDKALDAVQAFTTSGSPHSYWVARGFILQSDIYRKKGKDFEAREYLEALRDNYPGTETDIFSMIESRLADDQASGN